MSSPIRAVLSCMVLVLGVAVVAAQQPARQPIRQPLQPGAGAQPRQQGQIGQPGQIQQGQIGQQRQIGQPGQRGQWDQQLITLLIIENNKEIAYGQLAEQTSKNEKVQELAQMIQKDHGKFVQKLQQLAGTSGSRGAGLGAQPGGVVTQPGRAASATASTETRSEEKKDATAREDRDAEPGQKDRSVAGAREEGLREGAESASRQTVAKPVIPNAPGSELLQFCQDVAEECLNSARKEAQQQSGEEFDKHFVGAQIIGHKGMLDKLRVAERNASPQLAQLLKDAQGTTKQHLEHAEQLMAELGREQSREGAAGRERSPLREGAIERREGATERRERPEQ